MIRPNSDRGIDPELGEVSAVQFIPDDATDAEKKQLEDEAKKTDQLIDDRNDIAKAGAE